MVSTKPAAAHSASQRGASFDPIIRFGANGLIVPAATINPASSFSRAYCFASASLSKVWVEAILFERARGFRAAIETYHVCLEIEVIRSDKLCEVASVVVAR